MGHCLQSAVCVFQHMLKTLTSVGLGCLEGIQLPGEEGTLLLPVGEQTAVCTYLFVYFLKNLFSLSLFLSLCVCFLCFVFFAKSIIQDLKKNFEIVKLVTGSLISCHRLAASVAGPGGLIGATLVDGRYTYREVPNPEFITALGF